VLGSQWSAQPCAPLQNYIEIEAVCNA
jgi:hypothetical protein